MFQSCTNTTLSPSSSFGTPVPTHRDQILASTSNTLPIRAKYGIFCHVNRFYPHPARTKITDELSPLKESITEQRLTSPYSTHNIYYKFLLSVGIQRHSSRQWIAIWSLPITGITEFLYTKTGTQYYLKESVAVS